MGDIKREASPEHTARGKRVVRKFKRGPGRTTRDKTTNSIKTARRRFKGKKVCQSSQV